MHAVENALKSLNMMHVCVLKETRRRVVMEHPAECHTHGGGCIRNAQSQRNGTLYSQGHSDFGTP
eukprot:1141629-Pelagomonas_calceolata.AAC.7